MAIFDAFSTFARQVSADIKALRNMVSGERPLDSLNTSTKTDLVSAVNEVHDNLVNLTHLGGIKGDQGERGAQGIQGLTGAQGIQGLTGAKGDQGIQGLQGAPGQRGEQGVRGYTGEQGLTGATGAKGDKGEKGLDGTGTGTVKSVSFTNANGVSGTVANATTDPNISVSLGSITPTSISTTGSAGFGRSLGAARVSINAAQNGGGTSAPSLGFAPLDTGIFLSDFTGQYGLITGVHSTSGNVWLQAQRVDGNGTAYALNLQPSGGNVGIGTTTPASKLHVVGDATIITGNGSIKTTAGAGNATPGIVALNSNRAVALLAGTGGTALNYSDNAGFSFNREAYGNISGNSAGTNGVSTMFLASDGNVGIGTSNPTAKLDVAGTIRGQSNGDIFVGTLPDGSRAYAVNATSGINFYSSGNAGFSSYNVAGTVKTAGLFGGGSGTYLDSYSQLYFRGTDGSGNASTQTTWGTLTASGLDTNNITSRGVLAITPANGNGQIVLKAGGSAVYNTISLLNNDGSKAWMLTTYQNGVFTDAATHGFRNYDASKTLLTLTEGGSTFNGANHSFNLLDGTPLLNIGSAGASLTGDLNAVSGYFTDDIYATNITGSSVYISDTGFLYFNNASSYINYNSGAFTLSSSANVNGKISTTGNIGVRTAASTTNPLTIDQGNQTNVNSIMVKNIGAGSTGINLTYVDGGGIEMGSRAGQSINFYVPNRTYVFQAQNNAYDNAPQAFLFLNSDADARSVMRLKHTSASATANLIEGVSSDNTVKFAVSATGAATFAGNISAAASTASKASLTLPHGAAPSSPVNGDIWTTTAGLFVRINGTTYKANLTAV